MIRIVRTNAAANAFVNVLALEEITSLCDAPDLSCDGRVTVLDITLAAQAWNRNEPSVPALTGRLQRFDQRLGRLATANLLIYNLGERNNTTVEGKIGDREEIS